jgi:O-antigen/teichoic acid export membrane protein
MRAAFDLAISSALARSAFGTLTLQGSYVAISFVTVIVLARLLGANGFGSYAYGIAWASLLGVPAVLGLDRLITRDVAVDIQEKRFGSVRGLLQRSNQIVIIVSTSLALCATAAGLEVLQNPVRDTFAAAMILVPITAVTLLRQAALLGLNRPVLSQLPELMIRPLTMLLVISAIWVFGRATLTSIVAMSIYVTATLFAFLIGALLLRNSVPISVRRATPSFDTCRQLSVALPMMIISGIWIANGYVGTVMLGSLVDARSAGIYAVATRGADLVLIVMVAVNIPLAPRLARLHSAGDREGLQRLVSAVAKRTFVASLPLSVGLILLRDVYLGLFGSDFKAGGTALAILVLSQLVNVAAGPVGVLLLMTGYERPAALGVACGATFNVGINAVLDPLIGVPGAAIGALGSTVCWTLVLALLSVRRLGIRPSVIAGRLGAFAR